MKRNLAVMALVVSIFAKASSGVPAAHCAYADAPLALPSNNQYAALQDIAAYKAATRSIQNNYLLMHLVREVIQLDSNQNSPLVQLNNAFVAGSDVDDVSDEALAKTDDMINAAIAYIQSWLADQNNNVSAQQAVRINRMLNLVSTMLNNDAANAAKRTELINNDWDDEDDLSDVALAKTDDDRSNTFKVYKKAKFYKDVTFKDKASFDHFVGFHGNVHFHKNVEIGGSLSVADEIVNCDLTVGCNISMSDSISPEIGNVIKNGNPFITTYPGSASQNTFVGENAGNFTMTGIANTQNAAFGNQAMQNANPGFGQDTAIGYQALQNDTDSLGGGNVAIGWQAMQNASPIDGINIYGPAVAVGYQALQNDVSIGCGNTAIGSFSMPFSTEGIGNTAIGAGSLYSNTIGFGNTAIGQAAIFANTIGIQNTAVGAGTLQGNVSGSNNTAIGNGAMQNANPDLGSDVAIGFEALQNDIAGYQSGANVAIGYQAMQNANPTSIFDLYGPAVAVGYQALQNDVSIGCGNTAIGSFSMQFSTEGIGNTAIGTGSLYVNTIGSINTAIGHTALFANTIGVQNTAVGAGSLEKNVSGSNNTAIGTSALVNTIVGGDNTAVGSFAMAFANNILGDVAVGIGALLNDQSGNNTAVGYQALMNAQGPSNIALGYNAGSALNAFENNDIYIGSIGVAGESNTIRIGDQDINVAAYMGGIFGASVGTNELSVCVDSTGKLGTCPSSKRFKQNIADMAQDSTKIYDLRPVSFSYINDEADTKQYGLIAEEVAEIFPSLVVYDRDEQPLSVRYQVLPILLLNEVQKQHEVIEKQGKTIWQQGEAIDNIQNRLLALEHN